MSDRKPRRFFWFEGVTRAEVERSLNDTRPSVLRRQAPRRQLVVVNALLTAALALSIFIPQVKMQSDAEIALLAGVLIIYFMLRKSVRLVSDAPDELLDERQITIRNAAYTVAYRALCAVSLPYAVLLLLLQPDGALFAHALPGTWSSVLLSYLMCCASLPAMVLAWRLPDEPPPLAD
jgi:O-antigen ligase